MLQGIVSTIQLLANKGFFHQSISKRRSFHQSSF